jgi:hypothetical protein
MAYVFASAGDDLEALIASYDAQTNTWTQPMEGHFWDTVRAAWADGLTGAGRKVAIIDGTPDLSIPTLAGSDIAWLDPNAPVPPIDPHGTAVGLMVRTVAPEAALTFYPVNEGGNPVPAWVRRAVQAALESDADYICLSLGDPRAMELGENAALRKFLADVDFQSAADHMIAHRHDPYVLTEPCQEGARCLCNSIDTYRREDGPVLIAAAGNAVGRFCPARAAQTVSVGFMTEERTFVDGHQARFWAEPPYPQSDLLDITIHHLPGALGSSFAAPLFLGALALRDESRDIFELLRKSEAASAGLQVENFVHEHRAKGEPVPDVFATHLHAIYHKAWEALGDFPATDLSPSRKLEARLIYGSQMVNTSLLLWLYCRADAYFVSVTNWIAWAAWLMPYDLETQCNLGKLHLVVAGQKHAAGEAEPVPRLVARGREIYEAVLAAVPDHRVALAGMESVVEAERDLLGRA